MISSSPRHNVKNLLSASLCNPNRGHSSRRARLPPPQRARGGTMGFWEPGLGVGCGG